MAIGLHGTLPARDLEILRTTTECYGILKDLALGPAGLCGGREDHPEGCSGQHQLTAEPPCLQSTATSKEASPGYPSPSRYLDEIRDGIAAHLSERNASLLICLDDANYLIAAGSSNTLLYHLLRLYERRDVRGAGVFAITSDLSLNLCAEADGAVQSVFRPTEISFLPYTTAEVREILGYCGHQGLYPGVMPAGVLDLSARLTADARDIRMRMIVTAPPIEIGGIQGFSAQRLQPQSHTIDRRVLVTVQSLAHSVGR